MNSLSFTQWLDNNDHDSMTAYYTAVELLREKLRSRSDVASVSGRIGEDSDPKVFIAISGRSALSGKRIERAWQKAIEMLERQGSEVLDELRSFADSARVRENTMFVGTQIDAETMAIGMLGFEEPTRLMRGPELGDLTLEEFHQQFLEDGGSIVYSEPTKYCNKEVAYALSQALDLVDILP